ncbi:tyrosine-protein kinase [Plakobranchus ocellatus]|uniref:Tyrosine-protein kinase n=1 Tax=Plakobranchus ocellatus TaxID=259542 RepID=A0AAV4DAH0_9GAST|nr:tyrosine-protein kinase [Plakobranchus ocellatus]
MEFEGDFHIPQCNKSKCTKRLEELAQTFIKQYAKLKLVTEYPYGAYEENFKEAYNKCNFTILHKCHVLWEKISSLESFVLKNPRRVKCVTFRSDNRKPWEMKEKHHAFFNKLQVQYISSINEYKSFAKTAVQHLHQEKYGTIDQSLSEKVENLCAVDIEEERQDIFVSMPSLYDDVIHTDVFVHKNCLKLSDDSGLLYGLGIGAYLKLSPETKDRDLLPKLKHLVLKVLPNMFRENDVRGLAHFSVCGHIQVAHSAALLLLLRLLKNDSSKPSQRINELIVVESLLWGWLLNTRQDDSGGINQENSVLFFRLAVSYVIVLCDFILTGVTNDQLHFKVDTHLDTIDGRSLPEGMPKDDDRRKVYEWLNNFVRDTAKRKSKKYKEMLLKQETEQQELTEKARCIAAKPLTLQALVAYQTVKEVFKSMSENDLHFAKCYVEQRFSKTCEEDAVTAIIFQGFAMFVVFELKRYAQDYVESFCKQTMDVLKFRLSTEFKKGSKMDPLLQMLFFNPNPFIREATLESTVKCESKLFSSNIEGFFLNEMKRLLFPLMRAPVKTRDQDKQKGTGWRIYEGKFDDSKVLIHFHLPRVEDLQIKRKTDFGDENIFYNEMMILEKLQHTNIIKMVAFQSRYVPQFYIVEEHPCLQDVLKNKMDNQIYFEKTLLIRYLIQALEALEFCHSMGFIHRNLTAKSLFLVNDESVKLSGFHLCLKMTDGEATGKAQTNNMIPTRWSAPESLKYNKYSAKSDVWMFGHLMYEVLTHGCSPYAQVAKDSELMEQIEKGEVHLSEHPLIQRTHHDLITKCTQAFPQDRPALFDVKQALEQREKTVMRSPTEDQIEFDDFKDGHKASTTHGKGIPNTVEEEYFSEVFGIEMHSDSLEKITEEDNYIFREKLATMSPEMKIKVINGALADVLPYISIKESSTKMAYLECKVPRCRGQEGVDGRLDKVTLEKKLGESIKPYLQCLYQVALLLEKLHHKSWVIKNISMPDLHVHQQSQDTEIKIYVVSVANLQYYNPNAESDNFLHESSAILANHSGAAPELAEFGIASPWSDIYCFGNLMWETIMAFDCSSEGQLAYKRQMEENISNSEMVIKKWETNHKRPSSCSDDLYELMLKCTQHNSRARISAANLVTQLRRHLM